jgi:transcriptional regulator with XRE-family HTH domain
MPKRPAEVFSERLKAIPYGRQGRVAAEAGVDQTTLSRWKKRGSKPNPTLENIEGVARALEKPIAWLISDEEPESTGRTSPERRTAPRTPCGPDEYIRLRLRCPHCKTVIEETKISGKPAHPGRRRK